MLHTSLCALSPCCVCYYHPMCPHARLHPLSCGPLCVCLQGGYRACNRMGIESSVSPFLKMSFETAAHFLTDATLKHSSDDLLTPSARLCVGSVVEVGTGCMGLLHSLN